MAARKGFSKWQYRLGWLQEWLPDVEEDDPVRVPEHRINSPV
jgi:hypothetical protein